MVVLLPEAAALAQALSQESVRTSRGVDIGPDHVAMLVDTKVARRGRARNAHAPERLSVEVETAEGSRGVAVHAHNETGRIDVPRRRLRGARNFEWRKGAASNDVGLAAAIRHVGIEPDNYLAVRGGAVVHAHRFGDLFEPAA